MQTQQEINREMKKFLSNTDFNKYLNGASDKVVKYSDLDQFKSVYDLLPDYEDYRIILIEQRLNSGHWVNIARRGNNFCFLDSYGYGPIQNLNFVSKKMNQFLGQERQDFSGLFKGLKNDSYTLIHNKKKYQKNSPNINTCGRHVLVFIVKFIQGYSLKEYQKWMQEQNRNSGYSYDEIVTLLTRFPKA